MNFIYSIFTNEIDLMDQLTVVNALLPKDEVPEAQDINAKFRALILEKFTTTSKYGRTNVPTEIHGVTMQVATPNQDPNINLAKVYRDITTSGTLWKMGMEETEAFRQVIFLGIMQLMIYDEDFLALMCDPYHPMHAELRNPDHKYHKGWSVKFIRTKTVLELRFFPTALSNQYHVAYHKGTLVVDEIFDKPCDVTVPVFNTFTTRWFFTNENGYTVNIVPKSIV